MEEGSEGSGAAVGTRYSTEKKQSTQKKELLERSLAIATYHVDCIQVRLHSP